MTAQQWTGSVVRAARRHWAARLPLPCLRCTLDVLPDQRWQVDHIKSRAEGGSLTDPANQWPAHGRCNERAGQALATARRNRQRRGLSVARARRSWT